MTLLWIAVAGALIAAAALHLERSRRRRDETRAWARGVRSMLSHDADAAIEALSAAARLGSDEAIETYLALGALYRRAGELARAVRLHRNMLVFPGLDEVRRAEVERELAEDYRRSGMLAEASELLAPRAAADRKAAELLRDVLADQGRWLDAAGIQRRLSGGAPDAVLGHVLAAASRAVAAERPAEGRALAEQAVQADPGGADPQLALAEAAGAAGDGGEAAAALLRALDRDPSAAVMAWPAVAAPAAHVPAATALEARAAAHPEDAGLQMLLGRLHLAAGRNGAAVDAFRSALERDERGDVTVAMRDLLRVAAPPDPSDLAARHDLLTIALMKRARLPRCARCDTEAPQRQWRCRRCGAFDPHR